MVRLGSLERSGIKFILLKRSVWLWLDWVPKSREDLLMLLLFSIPCECRTGEVEVDGRKADCCLWVRSLGLDMPGGFSSNLNTLHFVVYRAVGANVWIESM